MTHAFLFYKTCTHIVTGVESCAQLSTCRMNTCQWTCRCGLIHVIRGVIMIASSSGTLRTWFQVYYCFIKQKTMKHKQMSMIDQKVTNFSVNKTFMLMDVPHSSVIQSPLKIFFCAKIVVHSLCHSQPMQMLLCLLFSLQFYIL